MWKNPKNWWKIVNIDEKNLYSLWLIIVLKVTNNGFHAFSRRWIFGKTTGEIKSTPQPFKSWEKPKQGIARTWMKDVLLIINFSRKP